MRSIVSFLFVMSFSVAFSQVSVSAGGSTLKGWGPQKAWAGFHVGIEIPRDDASSFYGRYTHLFHNRDVDTTFVSLIPRDPASLPPGSVYSPLISSTASMNYHIINLGTRYYLGDGYDFGWAGYGGSDVVITINKVRMNNEPYDEALYVVDEYSRYDGSAFTLGFGLTGGVKYSRPPLGTFYFDAGLSYLLLYQPNNPYLYSNMINQLTFNFNLGFRKDILW